METNTVTVKIPIMKTDAISKSGYIIPKEVFEKALEEWKQKGMPSVEIIHKY